MSKFDKRLLEVAILSRHIAMPPDQVKNIKILGLYFKKFAKSYKLPDIPTSYTPITYKPIAVLFNNFHKTYSQTDLSTFSIKQYISSFSSWF